MGSLAARRTFIFQSDHSMRTSNPALKEQYFGAPALAGTETMTLGGVVSKSVLLLLLLLFAASFGWASAANGTVPPMGLLLGTLFGALGVAILTVFKPHLSPITAPLYAVLEGCVLGVISVMYNIQYAGLPLQALGLTAMVFLAMLFVFQTGLIKVTPGFRQGVVIATGAIFLFYIASFVMSFFGMQMPLLHDSGPLGIGISLVIVGVAAMNLMLDFDLISRGIGRAPKVMEWYGGFTLMVTLVWLYLEMLRLLSKIRR